MGTGWLVNLIGVDYFGHVTVGSRCGRPRVQPMKRSRTSGESPDSKDLMLSHRPFATWAGASEGTDQSDLSLAGPHSGHRRRAGASEGATKLFELCLGGTRSPTPGWRI